jgi:DNA helicase-2/ATP-dependent DNA helicase PcrA
MFGEVKRMARGQHHLNLETFLRAIVLMKEHHLSVRQEEVQVAGADAVKLSTAHSSKGLEWEYVFIPRTLDNKWGNVRVRNLISLPEGVLKNVDPAKKEQNEDERRLFYVALTRAKKRVTITYPQKTVSASRLKETTHTMFLEELPKKLLETIEVESFEKSSGSLLAKLFQLPEHPQQRIDEKEWLTGLLKDFVLTPTSLNTYLDCAYKFKLNVLIKVPRAKQDYLAFGTAVHKALEMFYRSLIEHELAPNKKYLIEQFEKALKREVLTKEEEEKRLLQGQKILSAYYDHYKEELCQPIFLEKFLGYGWSRIYIDDVRIGGRIDKIEWLDRKHNMVTVVDYKTGQPKSRNEIEGKTANSSGDYKRQLLFYKLLADLDQTFKLTVKKGMFDFIEPDKQSGKMKREEFDLNKEEVEDLKKTIREVMTEIRALKFDRTTNYNTCERCEFKDHCWPGGIPKNTVEQMKLLE